MLAALKRMLLGLPRVKPQMTSLRRLAWTLTLLVLVVILLTSVTSFWDRPSGMVIDRMKIQARYHVGIRVTPHVISVGPPGQGYDDDVMRSRDDDDVMTSRDGYDDDDLVGWAHRSPRLSNESEMEFLLQLMASEEEEANAIPQEQVTTHKISSEATKQLPGHLIIGAPGEGSSLIIQLLNTHPQITLIEQELNFFSDGELYAKGMHWYLQQMPEIKSSQVVIDRNMRYLYSTTAPERVYAMDRDAKLILVLHNPLRSLLRCLSEDHSERKKLQQGNLPFEHFVHNTVINSTTSVVNEQNRCVSESTYSKHFLRWLQWFPRRQIHVVSLEQFLEDSSGEMLLLTYHLGLAKSIDVLRYVGSEQNGLHCFVVDEESYCLSEGRSWSDVDQNILISLRDFFKPYNKMMYDLAGRDLGWYL